MTLNPALRVLPNPDGTWPSNWLVAGLTGVSYINGWRIVRLPSPFRMVAPAAILVREHRNGRDYKHCDEWQQVTKDVTWHDSSSSIRPPSSTAPRIRANDIGTTGLGPFAAVPTASGRRGAGMTSSDVHALVNRVFVLYWQGTPVARLRSLGVSDMFWESFCVEAMVQGELLDGLLDSAVWDRCEFTLRHERTGTVVPSFFCPRGRPPSREQANGPITVLLRGTAFFPLPAAPAASRLRRLGQALVAPLRRWFK